LSEFNKTFELDQNSEALVNYYWAFGSLFVISDQLFELSVARVLYLKKEKFKDYMLSKTFLIYYYNTKTLLQPFKARWSLAAQKCTPYL
jgi:hypothetical protein